MLNNRYRSTPILSLFISLLLSFASAAGLVEDHLVEVQILSVNDFHGSLLPSDTIRRSGILGYVFAATRGGRILTR